MKIRAIQYAKLIYDLTSEASPEDVQAVVGKIVRVIKDNGDGRRMNEITREFGIWFDQQQGIVQALVTTARPIDPAQQATMSELIASRMGTTIEKVTLSMNIDPSLRGGMIVRIGNVIWDASIKRKVHHLTTQLTQ